MIIVDRVRSLLSSHDAHWLNGMLVIGSDMMMMSTEVTGILAASTPFALPANPYATTYCILLHLLQNVELSIELAVKGRYSSAAIISEEASFEIKLPDFASSKSVQVLVLVEDSSSVVNHATHPKQSCLSNNQKR